jgi:hypothetical protein
MAKATDATITVAIPAITLAVLLGVFLPGGLFSSVSATTAATTDSLGPHGYVVVSVLRNGLEVYHHEDHNLITTAGKDFIAAQIGSTSPGTNGANYIALTNTAVTPAAGDTTLSGEIALNGLSRAAGTYAHTAGASTFTVSKTFTATASQSAQAAGLFTASSSGTMMAENTFTQVSLANGDQLTITWTITLS